MMKKILKIMGLALVACQTQSVQETGLAPEQIAAILHGENIPEHAPTPVQQAAPIEWKLQTPTQVTQLGENWSASFSPDGQRLIYLSRQRALHAMAQIYEYSLGTKKERRISHQDGWIGQVRYIANTSKIIYSSTTDEVKEDLDKLVKEALETKPPTSEIIPGIAYAENLKVLPFEIYTSDLDGSNIARITDSKGFDAAPAPNPATRNIVFTSFRFGDGELFQWSMSNRTISRLTQAPGIDIQANYSTDGKQLAWVHQPNSNSPTSWILIGNANAKSSSPILKKPAAYINPAWNSDNKTVIFSSNFEDEKNFDLYTYNIESKCIKKLTMHEAVDKEPSFGPDGKKIVFTSNRNGTDQIYVMDFAPPEACMNLLDN